MKPNKKMIIGMVILALAVLLFSINRDLFHYQQVFLVGRTFDNQIDTKGYYRLTEPKTLKKGTYTLKIEGKNSDPLNQWVVFANDEPYVSGFFREDTAWVEQSFTLDMTAAQVSIGVWYDHASTPFEIIEIEYLTNSVLFRDSLLKHLTLSVLVCLLAILIILRFVFYDRYCRIFGKFASPANERVLIFLIFLTVLVSSPFFQIDYVKGDDSTFHMARIEAVKETLEAGYFPPRVELFFLNDYGYGSGLFYPDFFLLFPAILRMLGFGFISAFKIFLVTINFFSILFTYISVNKIAESRYAGLCGAILYGLANYRVVNVCYRGAVGEMTAMIFVPLIILGLYDIFTGKTRHWWILAVGCTGMAVSHVITPVITASVMIVFFILMIKSIISEKEICFALVKAGFVTIAIAGYFWFPLVEMMMTNDIVLTNKAVPLVQKGLNLVELFFPIPYWNAAPVKPCLGYPLVLLPVLRIFLKEDNQKIRKFIDMAYVLAFVCLIMTTSFIPWERVPSIHRNIQFPWRYLSLAVPLICLASAVLVDRVTKGDSLRRFVLILLFLSCIVGVSPVLKKTANEKVIERRGYHLQVVRISNGQYLPWGSDPEFIDKNKEKIGCSSSDCTILNRNRQGLRFTFEYETSDPNEEFSLPQLYYKGYHVTIQDDQGITVDVSPMHADNGLISINASGITHGFVTSEYKGTLVQKAADLLSLSMLLFLAGVFIWNKRKSANEIS